MAFRSGWEVGNARFIATLLAAIVVSARSGFAGAVAPAAEITALPVTNAAQIGAVRWFTQTGQVHQIYVAPARRRQGIGTALLLAAGTFAVATGWPRLWRNGERTELGESLVTRGHEVIRPRATAHSRTVPPMTPGAGDGAGRS